MQRDFHFYTIYVLARRAGFSPQEAEIVAYASQFTDDAYSTEAVYTREGGVFLLVRGVLVSFGTGFRVKGLLLDLESFCLIGGILSFLMYLDFYYSLKRLFLRGAG